jgi:hypothetical protein
MPVRREMAMSSGDDNRWGVAGHVPSRSFPMACLLHALLLMACGAPDRPLPIDPSRTLVLATEWRFSPRYGGVFTDDTTGDEFIFSGDPITHRKVRVFDSAGNPIHDIPLDSALEALGGVNSLALISKDSLFVLQEHGPQYVIIDVQGRVAKARSMEDGLCDDRGDHYEINGYSNGLAWFHGALYMETDWVGPCNDTTEDATSSLFHVHQQYFSRSTQKCKLAKYGPLDGDASVQFGACDILPHLTDTPRCTIGGVRRVVANGDLFVISPYSHYILRIDDGLKVADNIEIQYMNGPAAITPPPITADDTKNEGYNLRFATKPSIVGFGYDRSSKRYVAMVYHEVPETAPDSVRGIERDWSLIVLDSTFKKIDEHHMPGRLFWPGHLINTKEGVWVLSARRGRDGVMQPKVFHRLRLS